MKIGNNFKCLVENDEKSQLFMIEYIFKQHGFEVSVAENGKQAIEKVFLSIKKDIAQISKFGPKKRYLYDLVVLDLNMPICNGFEAC